MEVAEAAGLSTDEFHLVVKAFGGYCGAPHSDDFFRPSRQILAELHQLRQAGLAQLADGTQKTRHQLLTLFPGAMLFEQQIRAIQR